MANQTSGNTRLQQARVLWFVLSACCVLFALMPFISDFSSANRDGFSMAALSAESAQLLRQALTGFAALMAGSSLFLHFYLARRARQTDPARWFTLQILAWGINESIASVGLALATITHEAQTTVPFALVAIVLNGVMYPMANPKLDVAD